MKRACPRPDSSRRAVTLTELTFASALAILLVGLCVTLMVRSRQLGARTSHRLDQLTEASRAARTLGRDLSEAHLAGQPPAIRDDGRELVFSVCRGLADRLGATVPTAVVVYRFDRSTGSLSRVEGQAGTIVARLAAGAVSFEVSPIAGGGVRVGVRIQPGPPPGASRMARVTVGPRIVERVLWPAMGSAAGSLWSLPEPTSTGPVSTHPAD